MRGRVEKKDLVRLVSQRVHRDVETVEEILDATLDEITEQLSIAGIEPPLQLCRRIDGEHFLTPEMGDGHPEHGLPMDAAQEQCSEFPVLLNLPSLSLD